MISLRHFPPYVRNKLSVQEAVLLGMRAVQDQNHHARINLFLKTLGELPPGRGVGCQSHSNNSNKQVSDWRAESRHDEFLYASHV
jgi:hypothetical protein